MNCGLVLIGVFSLLTYASAINYCYKFAPLGGYAVLPEGQTLTEDKNCNEIKAELEAENAENPRLGRPTPRCMDNGHYDLYQCTGSVCHCTDCAGLEIEGFETFMRHEVDDSKCKCAREQHEIHRSGMVGASFRCAEDGGHYKNYQCQGTGCYCTDAHGEAITTDNLEARFLVWETEGKEEFCKELSDSQ